MGYVSKFSGNVKSFHCMSFKTFFFLLIPKCLHLEIENVFILIQIFETDKPGKCYTY